MAPLIPLYVPLALVFFALIVLPFGLLLTLWIQNAAPALHAWQLRRKRRRMAPAAWRLALTDRAGTTILDHPTLGWNLQLVWWTPDTVHEPAISAKRRDPEATDEVICCPYDAETAELCARYLDRRCGTAYLVAWGSYKRMQIFLREAGDLGHSVEAMSWMATPPRDRKTVSGTDTDFTASDPPPSPNSQD